MSRNVSSGSSPPLACYSRSDGGCCARVFDHRQLRSACRSGRHDSDRLKRWFMRTPLTSSTTSGVGCESACWASIPRNRSPATPSAAGVWRQASSRNRPCLGNESPSSPIRARACTTASAGPWPTWTRPTVGITRSKRRRAGAAHSYVYHGHPSARADEIAAAEQEATAAGRGLWGPPCFGQTTSVPI